MDGQRDYGPLLDAIQNAIKCFLNSVSSPAQAFAKNEYDFSLLFAAIILIGSVAL